MNATTSKPSSVSLSSASAASSALGPVPTTTVGRRQAPRPISTCLTARRTTGTSSATSVQLVPHHRREKLVLVRNTSAASTIASVATTTRRRRAPARTGAGGRSGRAARRRPRRRAQRQEQHQAGVAVVDPPVVPGGEPRQAAEQVVHRPPGDEAGVDHREIAGGEQPRLADRAAGVDFSCRSVAARTSIILDQRRGGLRPSRSAARHSAEGFALARAIVASTWAAHAACGRSSIRQDRTVEVEIGVAGGRPGEALGDHRPAAGHDPVAQLARLRQPTHRGGIRSGSCPRTRSPF